MRYLFYFLTLNEITYIKFEHNFLRYMFQSLMYERQIQIRLHAKMQLHKNLFCMSKIKNE